MYKIKLQPGDYCRRDMGEDKYRECAQRFFDDGCPGEKISNNFQSFTYFGWYVNNGVEGIFHSSHPLRGRELTYEQIMEKKTMTEPDWKTAPDGATHCIPVETAPKHKAKWYKKENGEWYYFSDSRRQWEESCNSSWFFNTLIDKPLAPIEFGAVPDSAWHETGDLPPVGVECEAYWENDDHPQWVKWTTLAISKLGVYVDFGDEKDWYDFSSPNHKLPSKFRPLQPDRDKAIEVISDFIRGQMVCEQVDSDACAMALYDAGYRKPDEMEQK